jgi:tetratricopeptide (TPR) repeat protein
VESKRLTEASLRLSNEIENTISLALCYTSLGGLAIHYKDFADAKKYFSRCLRISKKLDFRWLSSNAIKYLGQIALSTGDIDEAQKHLTQSMKIAYELGLDRDIANHLYNFAGLRAAQNKQEEGVELLSLLLQQPVSYQARSGGGSIRDRAKKLLAELESKLSQNIYEDSLRRGEQLDLDEVVIELVGKKNEG